MDKTLVEGCDFFQKCNPPVLYSCISFNRILNSLLSSINSRESAVEKMKNFRSGYLSSANLQVLVLKYIREMMRF